jgi:outer membrane receptor protein involved in Fe transport
MRSALALGALAWTSSASAQSAAGDSARAPALGTIVVTAERTSTTLASSVAAVTRLPAAELALTPRATLADVLRRAPGFAVIDLDGLGFDPQVMVRGFYGGGEAEYVVVLIDGRPVNQLQTGLVAWDVLPPLASIEAVEIIRGSASPLYGDAAIGGVINVITRPRDTSPTLRWDASGGTYGTLRASLDAAPVRGAPTLAVGGGVDRTRGFRDHAGRTAGRIRASLAFANGPDGRLGLTARSHWRDFDEPGALLESLMEEDRRSSDALFRFDHTSDQSHALTLDGSRRLGARVRIGGSLGGEIRNTDAVRTLALSPGFGDTKLREASNRRAAGSIQLDIADSPLPGSDWIVAGAELSHGMLDSRYYQVAGGSRDDYATASGERGDLDAAGDSRRTIGSLHGQYNLQPSDGVRVALGVRFDGVRDHFTPDGPGDAERADGSHTAFSPRFGLNLRYLNRERSTGNAYLVISSSFKAPTLDQLYDVRTVPIPFPPFAIRTSNPDLEPQRGTSLELGLYHGAELFSSVRANATLSVYHMEMKDELDFSVEEFRYLNIGRSRHRGVEAGATVAGARASTFANYTLQAVTSRSGANAGNRLKAIPRHTVTGGVSLRPWRMLETSVTVASVRGVFLDDANTVELPDFTRLDARLAYGVRGLSVFLDIRNVLNARYSSTGFLDPAGSGEPYFHPAAGRVIELGMRGGW